MWIYQAGYRSTHSHSHVHSSEPSGLFCYHFLGIVSVWLLLQYNTFSPDPTHYYFHLPYLCIGLLCAFADMVFMFNDNLEAIIALIKTSSLIKMNLAHQRFQFWAYLALNALWLHSRNSVLEGQISFVSLEILGATLMCVKVFTHSLINPHCDDVAS